MDSKIMGLIDAEVAKLQASAEKLKSVIAEIQLEACNKLPGCVKQHTRVFRYNRTLRTSAHAGVAIPL